MVYTWSDLFCIFYIYSLVGWCAGVVANALRRKRFVNTGFLNLPLCPVYGVMGVAYSIFLPELRNHLFFLFLGGGVLALVIVVSTGVLLEQVFHQKWWDYSKTRFQFQGYLTAWHLVFFGAAAVLCMRVVNPLLVRLVHMIPYEIEAALMLVLGVLLLTDTLCCTAVLFRFHHAIKTMRFMDYVQDFTEDFGNALTRKVQKRMEKAYPNIERNLLLHAPKEEKETAVFAEGCCFYKVVGLFFIGAFLGDITETVFCRITAGVWMSRSSVVYGSFSIVWGLGCAFLTAFLYKYKDRSDCWIFLYGTILGGAYEYICSVFTELVFGAVFWDYSKIPFNLGGRINLLFCFFWGIAAVVWLKILYPVFSGWIERLPKKAGKILIWTAIVLMLADIAVTGLALYRYSDRQVNPVPDNKLERFLDSHFDDRRMERRYPNARLVD